jgi:hypothetical protein
LKLSFAGAALVLAATAAHAQISTDSFSDGTNGEKVHKASGFVCPAKIGMFERDAVGDSDPETNTDFCAYSALNGVYGTIRLTPLKGSYDPNVSMADDFAEQEGTGGKKISERNEIMPGPAKLSIYTRTYETSKLAELHYRMLFTGAAFKSWALEATVEYAEPRDDADEQEFLDAVYAAAQSELGSK